VATLDRKTHVEQLLSYERWANERSLTALDEAGYPAAALRWFNHILGAQDTWLGRLRGDPPGAAVWPETPPAETAPKMNALAGGLADYLTSKDSASLDEVITYRTTAGVIYTNTPFEILSHLTLHSHYHRGQIAAAIREGGHKPAPTDFILFLRESKV
jgi:uncharacterized damage-inducible protein DinB